MDGDGSKWREVEGVEEVVVGGGWWGERTLLVFDVRVRVMLDATLDARCSALGWGKKGGKLQDGRNERDKGGNSALRGNGGL